jgi:hypothetical protein
MPPIEETVAHDHDPVVKKERPVKVMEDEEPRKEEAVEEEWRRDPGVQVTVIPWRRIIRNHRGTFAIVVVVNYPGLGILRTFRGLRFGISSGSISRDR